MTTLAFLTGIRELIALGIEMIWRGFAMALDMMVTLSAMQTIGILIAMLTLAVGGAMGMQKYLNKTLGEDPDTEVFPLFLEARYSLIGGAYRFIIGIITLPLRLLKGILGSFKKKKDEDEEEEEEKPVLVPVLGPSFVWAALIVVAIYAFALIIEPLIRWQVGAPMHFPTWQYLFFGHRPELAPFMPLNTYPMVATIVLGAFWLSLWWFIARVIRLWHWDFMGQNLIKARSSDGVDPAVLPHWQTHFGATGLSERDQSFDTWAQWLPWAAVPFLAMAFFSLSGDPYRVNPSAFSVALVAWVSWAIHLRLTGLYRPADEETHRHEELTEATAPGWVDVLNDLRRLHRISQPRLDRPMRDVEPLAFSQDSLESSVLVSPLIAELLPDPHRLTVMQQDVLDEISRHSFVHLDPPTDTRTLELGARARESDTDLRDRNQIVVSPEGTGKTTLAMLAAFNTALIHTRSTLLVVRDTATADRTVASFRNIVDPSTLRWNLRVRRVGGDLVEDLSQGIIPDVLVCDLQQLVTTLLEDVETYRAFLINLGLIIVDDLETFCGPVEVHAQLAFRRLDLRLRALRGVDQIGEEQAPIFLLLAGDTMDDLPAWARSLCGIDAIPRFYSSQRATVRREAAARARRDVEQGGRRVNPDDEELEVTADGRVRQHLIYSIADFLKPDHTRLSVLDIVEACEDLAVPWHYRPCGDDRRLLGRSVLPLRDEPRAYVEDPLQAAVVFLDGHATAVERELERLSRAGAAFSSRATPVATDLEDEDDKKDDKEDDKGSKEDDKEDGEEEVKTDEIEPIALITIVDDEEALLMNRLDDEALADQVERLPRPFLRAPSGYLTRRHLTGELIQHWTEVADLLEIFGNAIAEDLRTLTRQGAVLLDPRTTLEPGRKNYEDRVFLRGLEAEILGDNGRKDDPQRLLPPPVEDVEVASRSNVTIRERTTLVRLARVDAESARHRFYPGRIFDSLRGRHVVMGYADDNADAGAFEVGDILAEPFLGDELTSPRRRVHVELRASEDRPLTPEPLFLGQAPIGKGLFHVTCHIRHTATFRLDPVTGEVRQRIYRAESDRDDVASLSTQALAILPLLEMDDLPESAPLNLAMARLIAAALRMVLSLVYRGADSSIGVALHLADEDPHNLTELEPTDGFFLFDLHGGGNGAAQAIERDGIELLLRLAHHLIEHLHDPYRLLAFHDQWDGLMDDATRQAAREGALRWFITRLTHDDPDADPEDDQEEMEITR